MNVIEVEHITKDYGGHRGVFDVSFAVKKGEVFGFLGPNGAGKTTTIRQLMGFIAPQSGSVRILDMDCFKQRSEIQKHLGYLPGEIAFMDDMTGTEFIRFTAGMKGMTDFTKARELMDYFELDGKGRIRKMSKGTKQKIGLVCAFMQEPEILLLDEPTSGLDPLMQNRFIELVQKLKKEGATVLMSSHLFEEVEKTCDRTAIIKDGSLAAVENMEKLQAGRKKIFEVSLQKQEEVPVCAQRLRKLYGSQSIRVSEDKLEARVVGSPDAFIKELSRYTVGDLKVRPQTLEEIFMHFYGTDPGEALQENDREGGNAS